MDDLWRALLDLDDESTWSVFADHLQAIGDVRGELWVLEHNLARASSAEHAELARAHQRILAAHVGQWLGPLIAELDRDAARPGAYARELAALARERASFSQLTHVPRLFRAHDRELQLGWRAGFVVAARVHGPDERVARVLFALLESPAAAALSCLELDFDHFVATPADRAALAAPERLASVRGLRLCCVGKELWPADWLARSAPRLLRLAAENPDLSGLLHPRLERLRLGGQRLDKVLAALGRARLPALAHLCVDRFDHMERAPAALDDFLAGVACPALEVLRLGDVDVAIADRLLDALMGSPLLARLRAIEIEWPDERPELARLVAEYRAELDGLPSVAIRERAEPFCPDL